MRYEDWFNLEPRDWPHTPPLDVYLALTAEHPNLWWMIGCGHHLNLFEDAVTRLEEHGLV